MVKNFRHSCIVVKNLNRSLRFYKNLLGLRLVKIINLEGTFVENALNKKSIKLTYAKLRTLGQPKRSPEVFELHYWKHPKISIISGYNHISFTVSNLKEEYKRLKRAGVRFISKPIISPHGKTKICFCYDPDKHLIELVEDIRRK